MNRALGLLLASLAAVTTSCSDEPKPEARSTEGGPAGERVALGGDVAARASSARSSDVIPVSLVAAVAAEQNVPPMVAARRLVDDAVAAVAARDRGLDRDAPTAWRLVAARGRMTADRVRAEAKAAGPPSDEEMEELSLRHWREVDRPVSVRVVHFVVRRPTKDDPALVESAKALAVRVREAVLAATTPQEFIAKAKAVGRPQELEVIAQPLPAFTDDGYSIEGPDVFREEFVKAAHAIGRPGETSPVIETEDGFHAIRLVERLPEQRMPIESRRIAFTEEAHALRARRALEARLAPLRAAHPVVVSPSAEHLMRSVTSVE